ncbi:unnamed protein product [Parnassius mnemosyne]|uniref:UBL3-like ubiquitin domain-containing protein n=1 Tax=Parnassius mnemosyne TaxID=213953 RepID=A0AAV1L1H7_9NEOP
MDRARRRARAPTCARHIHTNRACGARSCRARSLRVGSSGVDLPIQKFELSIQKLKLFFYLQINLRLILVSGKTKEFIFSPVDSAGDIAVHVYDNWPEADWASECVSRAEILRLIYQGRFLHSSVTLGALGLPLGRTTVMHLVPREHLPEPNSHDQRQKSKGGSSSCCSASCCIL